MLINLANRDQRGIPGFFEGNKNQTDVSTQLIFSVLSRLLLLLAVVLVITANKSFEAQERPTDWESQRLN